MGIEKKLAEKKDRIVRRWVDQLLDTYGAGNFFKKQKDKFANPVGSTLSVGLKDLYAAILEGPDLENIHKPLDDIIRMRAVQDFTPSQAVSFIYQLKVIVKEELSKDKEVDAADMGQLSEFESRIDRVSLRAFDIYMECRERLYQVKINEMRSGRHIITEGAKCPSAMLRESKKRVNG